MYNRKTNNCWHAVLRCYKAYWGHDCPVQQQGENPMEPVQIHRGALRLVKHFGLADRPRDGCIVLMSAKTIIHHFGFYQNGLIHISTERGDYSLNEQQAKEFGLGVIKYLNTEVV
ncbi:hypothetical protein [Thiomicrorhabdus lithotrophica]|uniref:NlpC/P60 family protein n=1 Tax=Thiomicrorhabdus lithotrophica TaxID=2949997 RepID=A0ABY8C8A9_9GAMM|nr:hypothetical protein [Thiomicrorhabdus lithotrophica]WEJ62149.1 hypothetical protein NR989_09025 [Thiomicrorhabdus lithotrophica]